MKRKVSGNRRLLYITSALAGAIAFSGINTTTVSASAAQPASRLGLLQISVSDNTSADSLKEELISRRLEIDPSLDKDQVSNDLSRIDLAGFDRTKTGLQTLSAKVYLGAEDKQNAHVGYSFMDRATVVVTQQSEPRLQLKADTVTVNNGDAWNPFSYISLIDDDSKVLPAVKIAGTVNMEEDGDYPVHYTAVDLQGNTAEASLTVCVRTPQEVIEAREEAERLAREEAERIAAEEEAYRLEQERLAREEEERRAQQQAAAIAEATSYSSAAGSATGSAIASAARAWAGVGYYVWGGANPATGADCSGFTQYIYSLYGISLAHNNLAQAAAGYPVSAGEALPGDLVVWDSHVGIYTGNGYYVSAMSEDLGILEIPISWSRGSGAYWGIYRIPGVN